MRFRVSTDLAEMNFALIHDYIARSYWAKGRPEKVMRKAMENSLCFAVFDDKQQIGFARMVTDSATFGYLADVFIIPACRGRGASKVLMEKVISHPDLQGLRKIMLTTRDAHGLYRQYGFTAIADPFTLMEIIEAGEYQGANM